MVKDNIIYILIALIIGYLVFTEGGLIFERIKFIIFNNLLFSLIGLIILVLFIQQWQK